MILEYLLLIEKHTQKLLQSLNLPESLFEISIVKYAKGTTIGKPRVYNYIYISMIHNYFVVSAKKTNIFELLEYSKE